jgi:hypothetical protein
MTLPELQSCLDSVGVVVTARGDRLVVDAPAGALTPALKSELLAHKPALLGLLAGAPPPSGAMPTGADRPEVASKPPWPAPRLLADRTPPPQALVIRTKRGPRDVRSGDRWLPWH